MADPIEDQQQPQVKQATIILVSRNREVELEAALDAIQAATNRDALEVIVMDNGSSDNTIALREKYNETITFLKLPKNYGWVKAVNIALRSAHAEFILLADPTVRFEKDAIAKLIAALESSPEASAVVPQLLNTSGEPANFTRDLPAPGNLRPPLRQPAASETTLAFPSFQAFLVRMTFLRGMNFLDQRFGDSWADAEICFQINHAGKKILWAKDAKATVGPGVPPLEAESLGGSRFHPGCGYLSSQALGRCERFAV